MTRSLWIPPDSALPVQRSDTDPAALARELLQTDSLDVCIARALGRERLHVLHVDDWGATKRLPVNRRAWALYGGSPIHGVAVLSADDGGAIESWVLELVEARDFPPPEINAHMDTFLAEES